MSFQKTIKRVLTPTQRQAFDTAFNSSYSAAAARDADLITRTQQFPTINDVSSMATDNLNTVADIMFPYSRASDYAAITEGLSYLSRIAKQDNGGGSRLLGSQNQSVDFRDISKSEGVRFVKTALGFDLIDTIGDISIQNRTTSFTEQVFNSLQSRSFTPSQFIEDGRRLAESIHSSVLTTTINDVNGGVASSIRAFNTSRVNQLNEIFGGIGRTVPQQRLRDLGRLPEMKLRFLFYSDITLWDGTVYRLMTVKSVTGAQLAITQDEVNFYGLRSNVNKSAKYSNVTITLYDEVDNGTSNMFYTLMSQSTGAFGGAMEQRQRELWAIAGANNDTSFATAHEMIPSLPTLNERNGLIRSVKTTQVYMQDRQVVRDVYTYLNPKIVALTKSDFDMENSTEVQTLTIELSFDALNVETGLIENVGWRQQRDSEWSSGRGIF